MEWDIHIQRSEAKPRADLIDYTTYLYDRGRGEFTEWGSCIILL
jgi:hypothetical protein